MHSVRTEATAAAWGGTLPGLQTNAGSCVLRHTEAPVLLAGQLQKLLSELQGKLLLAGQVLTDACQGLAQYDRCLQDSKNRHQ
jgi:hypothetical protein